MGRIKSIITDYMCHFKYFIITKFKNEIKKWYKEYKKHKHYKWYVKACNNAYRRLEKIRERRQNQVEYTEKTGKNPKDNYGKWTPDYKDWIEENKGE